MNQAAVIYTTYLKHTKSGKIAPVVPSRHYVA